MTETLEDAIKEDPHVVVELAAWDLMRAISDLEKYFALIYVSDLKDLKGCMFRINRLILKAMRIRFPHDDQKRAVC